MSIPAAVRTLFLEELRSRGVPIQQVLDDGRYEISLHDLTCTVSLENVARDFEEDREPGRIKRFVDSILHALAPMPDWPTAQAGVRFSAEPADADFGDTLHEQVTESLFKVLTWVDPDETRITWLTPAHLEKWGQPGEAVAAAAEHNMAELLRQTAVHIEEVDEHRLGMFSTDSPFKASLIFAPNLKEVVGRELGWPIFAVIPTRSFAYVLAEKDEELVPRLGSVVVREYEGRGYPISTEVFRISDDGIEAVAEFKTRTDIEAEAAAEEGMKVIRYRGGVVSFRVPEHWEEEYEEDGGGAFYEDAEDSGTLRLNVLTLESEKALGPDAAAGLLDSRAEDTGGEVERLESGNALVAYAQTGEEEGEDLTTWYWEIANVLPPQHVRIAIFSFTVAAERADDPDILEQVELLKRELRQCEFAEELGE